MCYIELSQPLEKLFYRLMIASFLLVTICALAYFEMRDQGNLKRLLSAGRFTRGCVADVRRTRRFTGGKSMFAVYVLFYDYHGKKRAAYCDVCDWADVKRCQMWGFDQTDVGLLYLDDINVALITDLWFRGE
jgi:hypothetical protein